LEDLYELERTHIFEDSNLLAKLAQFLEIQSVEKGYPKSDMLKEIIDMLKEIKLSDLYSHTRSPFDVLANLDLPLYVTTNYDRFMEEALSTNARKKTEHDFCRWSDKLIKYTQVRPLPSVFDDAQYKPSEERPLVYHIHGDMTIPSSMVLTEKDYFEFVINLNKGDEKEILPSFIRSELADYESSFLFIGYSLEDINFRAIFQGFLSFLSSLTTDFRQAGIAVQPPRQFLAKNK